MVDYLPSFGILIVGMIHLKTWHLYLYFLENLYILIKLRAKRIRHICERKYDWTQIRLKPYRFYIQWISLSNWNQFQGNCQLFSTWIYWHHAMMTCLIKNYTNLLISVQNRIAIGVTVEIILNFFPYFYKIHLLPKCRHSS